MIVGVWFSLLSIVLLFDTQVLLQACTGMWKNGRVPSEVIFKILVFLEENGIADIDSASFGTGVLSRTQFENHFIDFVILMELLADKCLRLYA